MQERFAAIDFAPSGDRAARWEAAEQRVRTVAERGARFIVLPEGVFEAPERVPGPTTRRLASWARDLDVWIVGSLRERADGGFFVSTVLVDPSGEIVDLYRKVMARAARDGEGAQRGSVRAIIDATDVDGLRIGIMAGDDLQVGVARLATRGVDVVLLSSAWRQSDPQDWHRIARDLAREYSVDLVIANRRDAEGAAGGVFTRQGASFSALMTDDVSPTFAVLRQREREFTIPSALGLPPNVPVPSHQPPNEATAELGRKLFFDASLSSTGTIACSSCHPPALAFTNGIPRGVGVHDRKTKRNVPTLLNVAFRSLLRWDGYASSIENFVKYPISGYDEMDFHYLDKAVTFVREHPVYSRAFKEAMGVDKVEFEHIETALATYQRSLISGNSAFDRFYYGGDETALTASARRGYELFVGETGCVDCHTIGERYALFMDHDYHFLGLDYDPEPGASEDIGLGGISTNALSGMFQTPSLRNVELTAPYMHDGSFATLEDVIEFYVQGGLEGSDGRKPEIQPVTLDAQQRQDLIEFMRSLTGDHRYSDDGRRLDLGEPFPAPVLTAEGLVIEREEALARAAVEPVRANATAGEAEVATIDQQPSGADK
ncbi:MAG: cytochrome c peroxidase [Acidobacteriota bacterium]